MTIRIDKLAPFHRSGIGRAVNRSKRGLPKI